MNIKIYAKTINIIKNYKKILKIVYFITILKKSALPSQKIFMIFIFHYFEIFYIVRYDIMSFNDLNICIIFLLIKYKE